MATQTTLTFGGDATALEKAAARARAATQGVGDQARRAGGDLTAGARAAQQQEARLTRLGATAAGTSAAVGDLGASVGSVNDLMNRGRDRAQEHARALSDLGQAELDVEQATLDLAQAQRDAVQASIDIEQAQLDAKVAAEEYAEAVAKYGASSNEAVQASIDQRQAQEDLKQAQEDGRQATLDVAQAQQDAKDATLDATDAQRQANPGVMATLARDAELAAGVMAGAAGAVNLVAMATSRLSLGTKIAAAAQWVWNAAFAASGIGTIVIVVAALAAGIIYLATQTQFFQRLWKIVWSGIVAYIQWVVGNYKAAFNAIAAAGTWLWGRIQAVGSGIRAVFYGIGNAIRNAFRSAFNFVASAWNATIGRLSWSVPGWVPVIGGNSISAPQMRRFHAGGVVPGAPGTEVPIMAMAGETVTPPGQAGDRTVIEIRSGGARMDDLLVEVLQRAIIARGGNVQAVLGRG